MTMYAPSFDTTLGSLHAGQALRDEMHRTRESVRTLVSFVVAHHLTAATLRAFWRNEPRAIVTVRAVGKALGMDLAATLTQVQARLSEGLGATASSFQGGAAAVLDLIDGIAPCLLPTNDERLAAERYHYAADARGVLLDHTLRTLAERQPAQSTLHSLQEISAWSQAYLAVLQSAEAVIDSTRQILHFEAQAIQNHLATIYADFEAIEARAAGAKQLLHGDWRKTLDQAEEQIISHLAHRAAHLGEMAFGEAKPSRSSEWLDGLSRQMPRISALLATVAGGTALLHPASRAAMTQVTAQLPALSAPAAPTATHPIRAFFAAPQMPGLYTLKLNDQAALTALVEAMASQGYPQHDTLALFGLSSVSEMSGPLTVDVRWNATGSPMLLPSASAVQPAAQPAAPAVAQPTVPTRIEVQAPPAQSLRLYRIAEGETMESVATRFGLSLETLRGDNPSLGATMAAGQMLLVRQNATGATVVDSTDVRSTGSIGAAAPVSSATDATATMQARYGSTLYGSMDEMPPELHSYFATTVQEVADFFNVRPGDIVGILQAENNNVGLRVAQPAVSSAGARGVAQVIARTWNGWSNPNTGAHSRNLLEIEQNGGLGFDWSARETWRQWQAGQLPDNALAETNADPDRFDNSVAAIARHLAQWGLTRDRALSDPTGFNSQLADAISVYNSGRPLAEAATFVQSAANQKTVADYVREAMALSATLPLDLLAAPTTPSPVATSGPLRDTFRATLDRTLGVSLSDEALTSLMAGPEATAVVAGTESPEQAAQELLRLTMLHYRAEGRAALEAGQPQPWPFISDDATQNGQQLAVAYLGRTLSASELTQLVNEGQGQNERMAQILAGRADARLYASARYRFDVLLQRTARGLPIRTSEVGVLLMGPLAGHNPRTMDSDTLQQVMAQVEQAIQRLPEFQSVQGVSHFSAMPLQPMPALIRAFGAPVNYQAGGVHTGIDVANPRVNGEEPLIFAVADGTVAYVGPLYCAAANACRGGSAIVIDHGNDIYSIYSHNSAASVQVGQAVQAGQSIGRQGNEGYSFGSHLHFEVHTGASFSGNWERPFNGGQFEDPMKWLP